MIGCRQSLGLTLIACVVAVAAPYPAAFQQAPTFRAATEAVPLVVAVSDATGAPVTDLTVNDFQVLDNGQRAELVAFAPHAAPFSLRIVTAHTPRMKSHLSTARALALGLIEGASSTEPIAVGSGVPFPGRPSSISPFTTDKVELRRAVDEVFAPVSTEGAGWWFAVHDAHVLLQSEARATVPDGAWLRPGDRMWPTGQMPGVRAIVVISPGMEQYDSIGDPKLFNGTARRILLQGSIIYGIGFGGQSRDKRLADIAPRTSGWFVEPSRNINVATEVARILADLRSRYILGFTPVVLDGKEHTLSVKVARPNLTVRVRSAYQLVSPGGVK